MKTLHFDVSVNAPKEKVWSILWDDATYRQWTSAFMEGSYAVSDWKEGDKILFLDPEGRGMYSIIDKRTEYGQMRFKHIGEVKDGKDQPLDESSKQWSGGIENYELKETNGVTTLSVDVDMPEAHEQYFSKAFPKALALVKQLAEKQ